MRLMAVSKRLRFEILRRDNHACRYCGRTPPEVKLTVDHVTPEALGGRTEASNLVTACADCNGGKTSIAPDSALVDDVAEDALRWSRAIARAAEEMLDDLDARQAQRDEFLTAWNRWGYDAKDGRHTVPLPGDWENAVDRFMAAGLPMPILLECIPIAMSGDKVKLENRFRYTCGVAWNRVGELHEAAKANLDGTADDQDEHEARDLLGSYEYVAENFLQALPVWLHERAERATDHDFVAAGNPEATRARRLPHVLRHVGRLLTHCEIEATPATAAEY